MTEITLPCGRIVQGHPMEGHQQKDRDNNLKVTKTGEPLMSFFIAVAIAKGSETHWNQTDWGQQIQQTAVTAWPNGEHDSLTFAWKITDGDSTVPNKKGNKPCDKEGYPGHWVINIQNGFSYPCFHAGKYEPHQVIQNKNEIKSGDYVRVVVNIKGNNSTDSPGVYINPQLLELSRAGIQIISQTAPDASGAFSGSQAVIPGNAQIDKAVAPAGNAASPQVANPVQQVAPVNNTPVVNACPVIMNEGLDYDAHVAIGHTADTLVKQGLAVMKPAGPGATTAVAPASNAYLGPQ